MSLSNIEGDDQYQFEFIQARSRLPMYLIA